MASGWGVRGSENRCYRLWMNFSSCYVSARENSDQEKYNYCLLLKEDYKECLHHRKAKAHEQAIHDRYLQLKSKGLTSDIPADIIPDYRVYKEE